MSLSPKFPDQQGVEELVEELMAYGLTRNEAKILTSLAKIGPARASNIARMLKMNRTEAYRTLKNLHKRGLVEATLEHPTRFQATPFDKALEVLLGEHMSKVSLLQRKTEELKKRFQELILQPAPPAFERFQVLEGRHRVYQKLVGMFNEAKSEILNVLAAGELNRMAVEGVLRLLKEKSKAGVKVRMITEIDYNNLKVVEGIMEDITIRHLNLKKRPLPRVSVVDTDQAIFTITPVEEPHAREAEEVGLWINSKAFADNLRAYFEEVWDDATPAPTRIEAVKSGAMEEDLRILKGRAMVSGKYSEMLSSAKRRVDIWTTVTGLEVLSKHRYEELKNLKAAGVRIRIIAPITKESAEVVKRLASLAEVRHSEPLGPARLIIVDDRELMLFERIPDDDRLDAGYDVGFWTNSIPFIEMMGEAYEAVWKGTLAIYAPRRGARP